ncbi:MAG: hypothetical protein ACRC53_10105 [Plesiomonas sp.]|uniref:OspG family effector kinase n=1 Tax=Plesiomonas sp. TaxID=2486279 RepID=UPI003F3F019D
MPLIDMPIYGSTRSFPIENIEKQNVLNVNCNLDLRGIAGNIKSVRSLSLGLGEINFLKSRIKKTNKKSLSNTKGSVNYLNHQVNVIRKRDTAECILTEQCGLSSISAKQLLSKYLFPENSLCNAYTFALDLESSGVPPAWAEKFRIGSTLENNIPNGKTCIEVFSPDDRVRVRLTLGDFLGDGAYGEVFVDHDDPSYVIKVINENRYNPKFSFASDEPDIHSESLLFCRYYGSYDASKLFVDDNEGYYIRMYRVPGQNLRDVPLGTLPYDAVERFVDMLEKLNNLDIIHDDLHDDNVRWDDNEQVFYPIDLRNCKNDFFNSNSIMKKEHNDIQERGYCMKTIEKIKQKIKRG